MLGNVSISVHPCVLIKTIGATNDIEIILMFWQFSKVLRYWWV
jgi:hypothetical protein